MHFSNYLITWLEEFDSESRVLVTKVSKLRYSRDVAGRITATEVCDSSIIQKRHSQQGFSSTGFDSRLDQIHHKEFHKQTLRKGAFTIMIAWYAMMQITQLLSFRETTSPHRSK